MAVKKKNKPKSSNTDVYYICYKDEIVPTADQRSFIRFNFGAKRWLKNRMLEDDLFMYNEMGIHLHNTPADYKDQEECQWLKQADSLALANAQLEYEQSWANFYEGRAKMPRFHSKHEAQSYTTNVVSNGGHSNLTYDESTGLLKLPKLKTLIKLKLHRKIKKGGVLKSATISMDRDGRIFVSLKYEYKEPKAAPSANTHTDNQGIRAIGLDMSLEHLYVDSNGDTAEFPRFYRQQEEKLAKLQHVLSGMKRGSKRYERQKHKIAKLHEKIAAQRRDFLDKLSYNLAYHYDVICIEDLNMHAMAQGLHLGKSVMDVGWGMFTRMLEYKCKRFGHTLVKIDQWYPSSKTCCHCGSKKDDLTLSDRLYICPVCGNIIDRDWQAAINIKEEGLRLYHQEQAA